MEIILDLGGKKTTLYANRKHAELVCGYCETPVETAEELTETKWTGKLCPDCMEQQVWK
jgi:hypothetical protein